MKIFVNAHRTIMVTTTTTDNGTLLTMTVATRPDPDHIWGPPENVYRES